MRRESENLQRELRAKEHLLSQAVDKSEVEALRRELAQKAAENAGLAQEFERLRPPAKKPAPVKPVLQFRSQRLDNLSGQAVKAMLKQYGFYCAEHSWSKEWSNPQGQGIKHHFELQQDDQVVVDHATELIWQQPGSANYMTYANAEKQILELNKNRFADYDDWRLPTLEEAMSLMEREKKNGDLYIDPAFDPKQKGIWTADKESAGRAWYVNFYDGGCLHFGVALNSYVRAVRSGQSVL